MVTVSHNAAFVGQLANERWVVKDGAVEVVQLRHAFCHGRWLLRLRVRNGGDAPCFWPSRTRAHRLQARAPSSFPARAHARARARAHAPLRVAGASG